MLYLYSNIPCMFDIWADPVVHLILHKSSMGTGIELARMPKEIKAQNW